MVKIIINKRGKNMTLYRDYLLNKRHGSYVVCKLNLSNMKIERLGKGKLCKDRKLAKTWVDADIQARLNNNK
jgi:hypothetical protein